MAETDEKTSAEAPPHLILTDHGWVWSTDATEAELAHDRGER